MTHFMKNKNVMHIKNKNKKKKNQHFLLFFVKYVIDYFLKAYFNINVIVYYASEKKNFI